MKITKRDIGIIIMLVGVIALVLSYNLLYQKEQTAIETENAALAELKSTQSDLAELEANLDFYQSEITRMADENAEIESHYPAQILPENEIMYAVELEENNDIYFSNLSYGAAADFGTTGNEAATGVYAYDTTMSMTYQASYQGLKDAILYNEAQDARRVINSITASYDTTTGNLTGSMTIDQYSMTGTDAVYSEPYVPSMNTGTDNIFGTIELPVNAEDEAVEEEAVEGEAVEGEAAAEGDAAAAGTDTAAAPEG